MIKKLLFLIFASLIFQIWKLKSKTGYDSRPWELWWWLSGRRLFGHVTFGTFSWKFLYKAQKVKNKTEKALPKIKIVWQRVKMTADIWGMGLRLSFRSSLGIQKKISWKAGRDQNWKSGHIFYFLNLILEFSAKYPKSHVTKTPPPA